MSKIEYYSAADAARFSGNEKHNSERTDFARDRARIVHSSALRRLGAKTQVMVAGFDDFVRTRLTHSLEVAQIGRDIASSLGLSQDVVEAACLAHDLGHPPFGHFGESLLDEVAKDIGGFEGNAQTFRILTRLEPKIFNQDAVPSGLNLTRATLDAILKYPWGAGELKDVKKFNYYRDDAPVFDWVRQYTPENKVRKKCIEAQVMDLADDISYATHDVQDGLVSGGFAGNTLKVLEDRGRWNYMLEVAAQWFGNEFTGIDFDSARYRLKGLGVFDLEYTGTYISAAKLSNHISTLIGRFVSSAILATKNYAESLELDGNLTRYNADLILPTEQRDEIKLLMAFSAAFVMLPKREGREEKDEADIIERLVEHFSVEDNLEPQFLEVARRAENSAEKLRNVVDQIASLTDFSARKIAGR
ncbi:MAG: deoxyguanosinetriphosphate triphosphohydrolase [Candidatus Ancillula sp.]|nr:deoxyguanosinetriphosphate triphosphohydrolase [Candidatus Ancillula sp.]